MMNLREAWGNLLHIAYDLVMKLNPRKLAAAAVITDEAGRVLVLHSRFVHGVWSLPGGGVNRGENLDEAVVRECREELGLGVRIERLTGLYYHADVAVYVAIFRCRLEPGEVRLSHEHKEYRWAFPPELPARLRAQVEDALGAPGPAVTHTFR